jgi:hypothetical protein
MLNYDHLRDPFRVLPSRVFHVARLVDLELFL